MQDEQQVRHLYVLLSGDTHTERRASCRETHTQHRLHTATLSPPHTVYFNALYFLISLIFCASEDKQQLEMSLILTVLDKLAYFLSLLAFCVSVSYSWLK